MSPSRIPACSILAPLLAKANMESNHPIAVHELDCLLRFLIQGLVGISVSR
jgi:hypothetical protein